MHYKRFRVFGIGNVQSRADKFESLLQGTNWEMLEGSFDWRRIPYFKDSRFLKFLILKIPAFKDSLF